MEWDREWKKEARRTVHIAFIKYTPYLSLSSFARAPSFIFHCAAALATSLSGYVSLVCRLQRMQHNMYSVGISLAIFILLNIIALISYLFKFSIFFIPVFIRRCLRLLLQSPSANEMRFHHLSNFLTKYAMIAQAANIVKILKCVLFTSKHCKIHKEKYESVRGRGRERVSKWVFLEIFSVRISSGTRTRYGLCSCEHIERAMH